MAEELWVEVLGRPFSVHQQAWPVADPALAAADQVEVVIQINGKLRDKMRVPVSLERAALEERALASEKVAAAVNGKSVRKVIVVPDKLVNVVIG
ncbi:MAG: leucine--tRNA ligase, partial [Chloroflexota bacterium]